MLNGTPVIGRHNNDRDIRPHNPANLSRRLDPVHLRHLPVNEDHIIIGPTGPALPDSVDGLASAVHPFRLDSHLMKRHNGALADGHVIIHDQRLQMGEIKILFFLIVAQLLLFSNPQLHIHGKLRPDSLDGTHRDFAIHHIHNALGDRHPQTRSAV